MSVLPIIGDVIEGLFGQARANTNYNAQMMTNKMNYKIANETNRFNAKQAEMARDFNALEAQKARDFSSDEAAANRAFQTRERVAAQAWNAQQWERTQSLGAQANAYQRIGLNPASLAGNMQPGVAASVGMSGSQAQGTAASGPAASAAGMPQMIAPRMDNEWRFGSLSSQSQLMNAQASNQRIKNLFETERQRTEITNIIRDSEKKLSEKGLTDSEKDLNEQRIKEGKISLSILDATQGDIIEQQSLETARRRNEIKMQVLDLSAKQVENEYLPKLLSSQVGLNEAQAKALLQNAQAAVMSASALVYNSRTQRLEYKFDVAKYMDSGKDFIESQTHLNEAQAENQEDGVADVLEAQAGNLRSGTRVNKQNVKESRARIKKMYVEIGKMISEESRNWFDTLNPIKWLTGSKK